MDDADLVARSMATAIGRVARVEAVAATAGGVRTNVFLTIDDVISGELDGGEIVLREAGGRLPDGAEHIFGAPSYAVGEQVLVFVEDSADGSLHTAGMAMGKYRIERDRRGASLAVRDADANVRVLDPSARAVRSLAAQVRPLAELIASIRRAARNGQRAPRKRTGRRPSRRQGTNALELPPPAFTFLGAPSRWFEPDEGKAVALLLDPTGDAGIGPVQSTAFESPPRRWWPDRRGALCRLSRCQPNRLQRSIRRDHGPKRVPRYPGGWRLLHLFGGARDPQRHVQAYPERESDFQQRLEQLPGLGSLWTRRGSDARDWSYDWSWPCDR
jgi:hypothetical protein